MPTNGQFLRTASTTVSGINIDLTSPVTTATVGATGSSATGRHTVTLTAVDNLSGVAQTFYVVDGGKPQIYSGPFALSGDADHTVAFWSVDKAGNAENYKIVGPAGGPLGIASAVYDPTDHTVTLKPKERIDLHDTYHLKVVGTGPLGVMSEDDIMLDGAGDGLPGSDYVASLT
jgi:hypothetical protein